MSQADVLDHGLDLGRSFTNSAGDAGTFAAAMARAEPLRRRREQLRRPRSVAEASGASPLPRRPELEVRRPRLEPRLPTTTCTG